MGRLQARSFLYPGHIILGNGPHTVCTVCQVMNSVYGLGYSYYGEVRLVHSFILAILYQVIGHTCQIMGLICPLATFSTLGRFFPWDVFSPGTLCPQGHFVSGTFCPWNVLSLGRFVLGHFVLGRFVCASNTGKYRFSPLLTRGNSNNLQMLKPKNRPTLLYKLGQLCDNVHKDRVLQIFFNKVLLFFSPIFGTPGVGPSYSWRDTL